MPFSVAQLRIEMTQATGTSGMLNAGQLAALMNPAANVVQAVNALMNALVAPLQWGAYWADLGNRINALGGNIATPTANPGFGLVLPPALPPNFPAGHRGLVILLNDCFDDTWHWMQQAGFNPAQALANHIRLLRL